MAVVDTKCLNDLQGSKFWIPKYQRGYRWGSRQAKDFVSDLWRYSQSEVREKRIYCLQPLVVATSTKSDMLEVIDGQQRLTTLFILLKSINKEAPYSIDYETRAGRGEVGKRGSAEFLQNIENENDTTAQENIDFFYMYQSFQAMNGWLEAERKKLGDEWDKKLETFITVLEKRVKFIWYNAENQDPIAVFTRLNIGKIPLTNAELVKALILNRSNYDQSSVENLSIGQGEIALKWDNIERDLHDPAFWRFLRPSKDNRTTRIDFLLDMVVSLEDCLNNEAYEEDAIAKDDPLYSFRVLERYFRNETFSPSTREKVWKMIDSVYSIVRGWFDNLQLYHYVGYLLSLPQTSHDADEVMKRLFTLWKESEKTSDFLKKVEDDICKSLSSLKGKSDGKSILDIVYDGSEGPRKTEARRLLLLHNIETSIRQNIGRAIDGSAIKMEIFYRFPFHLFKEEHWDVEHVDSNTTNELNTFDIRKEWVLNAFQFGVHGEDLRERVSSFCCRADAASDEDREQEKSEFEALVEMLCQTDPQSLSCDEKNQIWNFVLLDRRTNRSYQNDIFPAKRRILMGKDRGVDVECEIVKKGDGGVEIRVKETNEGVSSPFVAPCTKHVFLKYYTPMATNPNIWSKEDADAYKKDISEVLKKFLG